MPWWRRDKVEQRSVSIADPAVLALLGYTPVGGVVVSESTAVTLSAVWRALSLISGSIATLPLRTLQEDSDGTKQRAASFLDNPCGSDGYTPFEWKEIGMAHLLLHGNSYHQIIRNGAGAVSSLNLIHPSLVTPEWDPARPGGKVFKVNAEVDGEKINMDFDAHTMVQVMGISFDGLRGMSPITAARLSLATAMSGDKSAQRMFSNGALISGLVTPGDGEDLTAAEATEIKESINQKILGPEHAGDIAVINRKLNFAPWTLSAEDAQFIQSRTFQIDEVGRWFGVPPHLLGLTEKSTSWGQGIAEQNRGLARYTLTPWTTRIDERMTRLLGPGKTAEFDYTAFIKPSPEDEINLLIAQVNSGLLTLNEARKIRNLPPVDGGDVNRLPPGSPPLEPEPVEDPPVPPEVPA